MNEPYINQNGDLIIPNGAAERFQWWNESIEDRLSLSEILDHVNAPVETRARYLGAKTEDSHEDQPADDHVDPNNTGEFAPFGHE